MNLGLFYAEAAVADRPVEEACDTPIYAGILMRCARHQENPGIVQWMAE